MRLLWGCLCILLLAACGRPAEKEYAPVLGAEPVQGVRELRVSIHPLHNPQRLMEVYGPIVDHLNAAIPEADIRLEASRNYEEYERKLYAGYFDFAMPNPYQTVMSLKHGYRVIAKMADDEDFRGLILVRRDGPVKTVADLKGLTVAYPAPTALAATLLPQYFLQRQGLDVNRDIKNLYVGSQESSILSVQRGHVAAAATWPLPWRAFSLEHPELAAQLEVRWQTETLQNNAWVVRKDVPEPLVQRFTVELLALKDSEAGRLMLQRLPVSAFEAADDGTYEPVRRFLADFARRVRPVEE
jgi:phosphonate transport system substrate-binding protein